MGLDLYHFKAVMTQVTPDGYCYVSEFPPEAFDAYGFGRFVQDVPDWRTLHVARFFEDAQSLEHERTVAGNDMDATFHSFWLGTPETNDDALRDLEHRFGLDRNRAQRSTRSSPIGGRGYRSLTLLYDEPAVSPGIYTIEAGYQRKGMTEAFYEHFCGKGSDIFVREQDFRSLEGFLDPGEREAWLSNLRENFVDSYERGTSFLFVSS